MIRGGVILGGGVLLAASTAGNGLSPPTTGEGVDRPIGSASIDGWIYPLATWQGYAPVVSDGPGPAKRDGGTRSHNGADIDYRAKSKSDLPQFPIGNRQRSSGGLFFCPDGVPILAARDGHLWSCTTSARGLQIVIDHGKPYATYYQHMRRVFFPIGTMRGRTPNGERLAIKAGQVIGLVGNGYDPGTASPSAFNHLHFEIWQDGGAESWIDPMPILGRARVLDLRSITVPT